MRVDRSPHCEPEAALARLEGDKELYGELVSQLFVDVAVMLQKLDSAIRSGNSEQVHYLAHSLKGQSATCGATALADFAAELELLGRENQLDKAPAVFARLAAALPQTRDELADYAL
jgi:two-component system, sensor histidine kinase and response regulator